MYKKKDIPEDGETHKQLITGMQRSLISGAIGKHLSQEPYAYIYIYIHMYMYIYIYYIYIYIHIWL